MVLQYISQDSLTIIEIESLHIIKCLHLGIWLHLVVMGQYVGLLAKYSIYGKSGISYYINGNRARMVWTCLS